MLEGEIRDIDLVARLVELWREKFTGAIRFENDGIIKIIYFKDGDVLSASTNDRADSVDEILMRAGKVSREHVKQALAKRKETETLGDTLLNLGFITRKELTWARRVQVVGVIRSIEEWKAGSYTIVADYLPKRDEGTIFPLPQIIVEMVVTDQDRQKFERSLESGSAVFSKPPGFAESFAKLGLNEEADAIVSEVDGERTAAEVAAASRQETFNTYKLLHALSLLGLLTRARVPEPALQHADSGTFEGVGVADAADAWSGETPKFDFDNAPGQETTPLRTPPPPMLPPEEAAMPAWDLAPRGASPSFAPAPEPPAEPAEEKQWGFDEAQIESTGTPPAIGAGPVARDYSTTRRNVRPRVTPKKKSSFGLLVTLMALFIIAAGGYFAFTWWNARNATATSVVAVKRPLRRPIVRPAAAPTATTAPVVPLRVAPPTPAATTSSTPAPATATTASVAPPPAPPAAKKAAHAAKPMQTAPSSASTTDRERYDAMAREFAAAPSGNFTVQFEIVCEPGNLSKALRAGGTKVWFVPISLKGRACYRVFWGHFDSREAAQRGIRDIPPALREATPAVVSVPRP